MAKSYTGWALKVIDDTSIVNTHFKSYRVYNIFPTKKEALARRADAKYLPIKKVKITEL